MIGSTEKDGIVYFDKPYLKIKRKDWIGKHLDCDSVLSGDSNSQIITIVCYAASKEYNSDLYRYFKEHRESMGLLYLRGIGSNEINRI